MIRLIPSPRFDAAVLRMDSKKAKQAQRALEKFQANPRSRGLHFEQLEGTENYTIRANRGFRICLRRKQSETYDVVDVGAHDYIYKKYGTKK